MLLKRVHQVSFRLIKLNRTGQSHSEFDEPNTQYSSRSDQRTETPFLKQTNAEQAYEFGTAILSGLEIENYAANTTICFENYMVFVINDYYDYESRI